MTTDTHDSRRTREADAFEFFAGLKKTAVVLTAALTATQDSSHQAAQAALRSFGRDNSALTAWIALSALMALTMDVNQTAASCGERFRNAQCRSNSYRPFHDFFSNVISPPAVVDSVDPADVRRALNDLTLGILENRSAPPYRPCDEYNACVFLAVAHVDSNLLAAASPGARRRLRSLVTRLERHTTEFTRMITDDGAVAFDVIDAYRRVRAVVDRDMLARVAPPHAGARLSSRRL